MVANPNNPTSRRPTTLLGRLTLAVTATLLVCSAAVTACADVPFEPDYPECRCLAGDCAPSDCSFHLNLDKNCADDIEFAEVLINDHLEVETIQPGEVFVACSRVPVGTSAKLWIRGGSWIWDQTRACTAPDSGQQGRVIAMTLQCSE